MAVIINDFELIVEEAEQKTPAQRQEGGGKTPALKPMDLQDAARHQEDRERRLRAH